MASEQMVADFLELVHLVRRLTHPVQRGEITPEQYWLLRRLGREGPLSVGELASRIGIAQSSATTACQRLERIGLVTRERQKGDERVVLVALTEEGRARLDAWSERRHAAALRMLATLSPGERSEFGLLLRRVLLRAQEMDEKGDR